MAWCRVVFFFCWSCSLIAEAHIIKYEKVESSEFELQSLHKLCNVLVNWARLTKTCRVFYYSIFGFISIFLNSITPKFCLVCDYVWFLFCFERCDYVRLVCVCHEKCLIKLNNFLTVHVYGVKIFFIYKIKWKT